MKKKLIVTLLAVLALGACSEQDVNENQRQDGQQITFAPTVATDWNGAVTRAAMQQNATAKVQQLTDGLYLHTVTTPGFESDRQTENVTRGTLVNNVAGLGGHFGVSGYSYNGTASSSATADFLYKADVALVNNNWTTNQHFIWPQNEHIDFYGYAPYNDEKVAVADATTTGPMQIAFTVAADTAAQVDLMTAVSEPWQHLTDNQNVVPLTFKHQLTAIQFAIDKNIIPGVLEKIAFENISMAGTLTVGDTYNESTSWALSAKTDYELDFTAGNTKAGISLTNNNAINTNVVIIATPLLMIPQAFADGNSRLVVTIREGQETYDLSASLAETKWLPGTTVTYKISTSSVNVLRISGVTYPTSWNAASNELNTIKSSYSSTDGDALGLYAIDANGAVVKENERLAKTSTGWADNILFVPDLTYFAYYPYREDGLAHSGTKVVENETVAVTTAEEFFAAGISSWTPEEDQNTAAELNAQDLQIGTGVLESASTLSFSMAHAMGLTSLTLGQGSIPRVRYFRIDENGNESTTGYIDSDESVNITASTDYTTTAIENINQKMLVSGQTRFYVVNPAQSVITLTGPSTGDGSWETPNVELDVTADHYKDYSVNHHGDYYFKGWLYQYRGKYQTFPVPTTGDYTIECWGASSYYTDISAPPGYGAYVRGKIELTKNSSLYLYVGGQGSYAQNGSSGGGWNGGGNGTSSTDGKVGAGGGATDVRQAYTNYSNEWNLNASLLSRIMVAGAGGSFGQGPEGGCAGGLTGYRTNNAYSGYGGTQTGGGSGGSKSANYGGPASSGGFGYGSAGHSHAAGGGSGWYGGAGGTRDLIDGDGGGGSSYISGHAGCVGKTSTGAQQNGDANTVAKSLSYTGLYFTETKMIDGKGYAWTTALGNLEAMPNPLGGSYAEGVGHKGSGYVRITSLTPVE